MNLIVGLGNPGTKYAMTKHNVGFWIIDQLVSDRSLKYKPGKGDFVFAKDQDSFFVKPTTYVNNSGIALKNILDYYDLISVENLIVIYDDIDIDLGKIKFKAKGSDGGHKGVESIIYHLRTNVFDRLKIGIGTDMNMRPSEKYVLKPFSTKYNDLVDLAIKNALDGIKHYLEHGIDKTMNEYNKRDNNNG